MGIRRRRRKALLENYVELRTEKYKVTERTLEVREELGALRGTGEYARLETFRKLETLGDMRTLETA